MVTMMKCNFKIKKVLRYTSLFLSFIFVISAAARGQNKKVQSKRFVPLQWYANSVNSNAYSKKINIHFSNMPLVKALKKTAAMAHVRLSYNKKMLGRHKVTASGDQLTIIEAFEKILKGTHLQVLASANGQLVIKEKSDPSNVIQQETVSGTVTDAKTGKTLIGANILIKGTSNGGITDNKGHYSLSVASLQDTLVFSYIGYRRKTVPINGRSTINVSLKPQVFSGQQMVVIGFGKEKKANITGAISSVKAKKLSNAPVHRIEQTLEGRVSGVRVTSSSGAPGAASTVRIRGTTSINNSDPLYVVDGMPVDNGGINYLDPNDIKSIQVLKDAASAAIYGTRAASGVILVTTKHGTEGNMQISYNGYFGIQQPAKKLDLLNAAQYATLRNESSIAAGNGILFPDPQSLGEGTDWQNTLFNNSAAELSQHLSFSGGSDNMTYFASLGYFDQQGIVASPISHQRKYSFRLNTTFHPTDWLKFGENFGYTYIKTRGSLNTNSEFGGPLSSAINLDPITPVAITDPSVANSNPYSTNPVIRNAMGQPYAISQYVGQEMTNPLAYVQTQLGNYGWSHNFVGNLFATIDPYKGLEIKTSIGLKPAFYGNTSFTPIYYLSATSNNLTNNSYYRQMNLGFIWQWDNTIQYTRDIGPHHFKVMLGTSTRKNSARGVGATYQGIPVDNFDNASMNFSVPNDNRVGSGFENQPYGLNSYFGRINYNYKQKYLITGVLRRDGSSRFGSANRYGLFPSVSAGWVPSLEKFWPENNVVTSLKIRASYGVNGNDKSLGDFQYESTVSGGRNYVFGPGGNLVTGASPNAPANPGLQWEKTKQIDVGFDATLFESFRVTFDMYDKKTTGMLLQVKIPGYVGASGNPFGNVASLKNRGVELSLNYQKQIGSFNVNISGNASYNQNTVTDIGDNDFLAGATFQASAYEISRTAVGQPIGSFYGFKTLGIFQTPQQVHHYVNENGDEIQPNASAGDFKWADLNGDGKIDSGDRTFIGAPTPPWSYGITASAAWRNVDIRIFGQGAYGNEIFQGLRRLDLATANYTTRALNRWTGPGTSNTYPRLDDADPNHNFTYPSKFYLSSGSYFRIKTVQVGYTLPVGVLNAIGIQKLRIYVEGKNLVTFTNYTGYDPEIGGGSYSIDRGVYPQARSIIFGLDLNI